VKKLHKHKGTVNHVLTSNGGSWNNKVIFSASFDGEICIFGKDNADDFVNVRTLNIKKINSKVNITALSYQ
jgi:hypothetical protein